MKIHKSICNDDASKEGKNETLFKTFIAHSEHR